MVDVLGSGALSSGDANFWPLVRSDHDPDRLAGEFASGAPFPHVVIDDFLDGDLTIRLFEELEDWDLTGWLADEHEDQQLKRSMPNLAELPPTVASTLAAFNSKQACEYFSRLSGIPDLQPDEEYFGGGVHVSMPGGVLGVHADFNLHPGSGLHRRLNALLYLNPVWDPTWNGHLEMWDRDLERAEVAVDPIMNRLIVFRITDDAFHGVRSPITCPPGFKRWSLALYYYSADRPDDEKGPFHWAQWRPVVSAGCVDGLARRR